MTEQIKPPVGCQPRAFWLLDRGKELSRAIHEQLAQGFEGRLDMERLDSWVAELQVIIRDRELKR